MVDDFIFLNSFEVFGYDMFVHIFLLGNLFLVSLEGLLPSVTLSWIAVLDDTMVLIRAHIATVM